MTQAHQITAMGILVSGANLSSREGGFLGQIAFDPAPLTEKQKRWLDILTARYGTAADEECAA